MTYADRYRRPWYDDPSRLRGLLLASWLVLAAWVALRVVGVW